MIIQNDKGLRYKVDKHGIHQIDPEPFKYDPRYCSTYDSDEYRRGEDRLNASRLGFAMAAHGRPVNSILDFGCGNYAFLKQAAKIIPHCQIGRAHV